MMKEKNVTCPNEKGNNELEVLAIALYEMSLDMDACDYEETKEEDIVGLTQELQFLKNNNCNRIINALKLIAD